VDEKLIIYFTWPN